MNEKEFLIFLTNKIKDYALDGFYKDFNIRTKQDGSIVTDIDLMVEKKIFKIISKFFPEDSFLGEETGFHRGKNSTMWVVDPIDGTRAFSQHRSEWGVLIARSVEGVVKTGIVVCPVQDIFTVVHNNELVYTSFDYKNLNKNISDKISILIHPKETVHLDLDSLIVFNLENSTNELFIGDTVGLIQSKYQKYPLIYGENIWDVFSEYHHESIKDSGVFHEWEHTPLVSGAIQYSGSFFKHKARLYKLVDSSISGSHSVINLTNDSDLRVWKGRVTSN